MPTVPLTLCLRGPNTEGGTETSAKPGALTTEARGAQDSGQGKANHSCTLTFLIRGGGHGKRQVKQVSRKGSLSAIEREHSAVKTLG